MVSNKLQNSSIIILVTYFSLGAFALISQTMILREFFVVVYGNEFIFGVLLTNWLVGIFGGALAGAALSERSKNNLLLFALSILAMSMLLPLSITLTRLLYSISGTAAGTFIGFFKVFWLSACFIIPISFFIGFVFPIAARVQLYHQPADKDCEPTQNQKVQGLSRIYIYEAFGSLLAGVVYTFWLAGALNSYQIAALVTLPLTFCTCLLLRGSNYKKVKVIALLIFAFTLISCLTPVSNYYDRLTVAQRWRSVSTIPLTYSVESRYQNIAVANLEGQYNLYLNTMFASVFPNDQDNMVLAAHLICQHPAPKRILVIGDAVSGLAKFLLRFDVEKVVSVEIDAQTVAAILLFLPEEDKKVLKDPRFKIVIRDGRKYVKDLLNADPDSKNDGPFDLVYVNVSEPSTLLLNRYYTAEFFNDLAQVMPPDGVTAIKITSSENYEKGVVSAYTSSVYNTLKAVFPQTAVTPGTENFIVASRLPGIVGDDPLLLEERYESKGVEPLRLGMIFESIYPKEKTHAIKTTLQTNQDIKINTDETPIASLYFNKIIGWYGRSSVSRLLGFFEKIQLRDIFFFLSVLFLIRILYVSLLLHKRPTAQEQVLRFHTLTAVFASGLTGLSLELVILYTFQSNYGEIYHVIGLIIALFMFGLPLGAIASNRLAAMKHLHKRNRIISLISFIQIVTAAFAYSLPWMMKWFIKTALLNQAVIFISVMTAGFAIGLIFPLTVHLYLGRQEKAGRTAGIINAFDHFGAAVGAFFIGTLLLPVIGVEKVCTVTALFPFVASVLLFIDVKRHPGATVGS